MKCLCSLPREEGSGGKVKQGTFAKGSAHSWHILASSAGGTSDVRDGKGLDSE